MKNILVTGGLGYIGSLTSKILSEKGYKVTIVDNLMFKQNAEYILSKFNKVNFVNGDVRDETLMKKLIKDNDIIIPLAGIVGAPLCDKMPKETMEINTGAVKYLSSVCSKDQLILMPVSNSGYGIGEKDKFCDENSPLKPVSLYGRSKVEAEKIIMERENSISFRLATVFGVSSFRMRSDLMVNNFIYLATKKEVFKLFEPNFRRNFVHLSDVSAAFDYAIDNFLQMKGNIFNLGLNDANLTKIMLCEKIKEYIKDFKYEIIEDQKDPDQRDYFVSNEKLKNFGFEASFGLDKGILELVNYYKKNLS
tara:strand:+ start:208 stop:1128 length:921 start_codon:yes stop_codon:yes gene_type:complete